MRPLPAFLAQGTPHGVPSPPSATRVGTPILEKGIHHLAVMIQNSYLQWESSRRRGLLQTVDPRIKVLFLAVFLVLVSLKRTLPPQIGIFLALAMLAAASRLELMHFYRRVGWSALLFGVLVPLPSLLNLFDHAPVILPLFRMEQDLQLWIYRIPATIGVSGQGLKGMSLLTLRIANSISLSMLALYTTPFPDIIKALRIFRVPESFIIVITLAYKYVHAFSRTVLDMHLAKKSRLLGPMDGRQSRQWAAGRIAFLFQKTQMRCTEIYKAMLARGFGYSMTIHRLPPLGNRDYLTAGIALLTSALLWAW